MTLRYTSGGAGSAIAAAGFNVADVSYVSALNELPAGMLGLVYLGEKSGATDAFKAKVKPFIGNPKLYGFFLCDEPDARYVPASLLKAESDYIHTTCPGAKTFISMNNMGSVASPSFMNTYNPANTGIDLYGIGAYPIKAKTLSNPDYAMIDRMVAAALASGIPLSAIVPEYQAFGGGNWISSTGDAFVVPTVAQMQTMLDRWAKLVPSPQLEYCYKWSSQNGDTALGTLPELQKVFLAHNTATAPAPTPTPVPTPVPAPISTLTIEGQPATQAGIDALVAARNAAQKIIASVKTLVA
ncbi:hypothetical protein LB553_01040 [Mesorhizobium sp. CA8]|uniref:hypothetical protein n=1 Tax=Mesorhizobium sp. CA8 TaxID=2876637 RepID=UPI001CCC76BF|nr:hypothetical protein [Mesorhizobium sp. CA8]MBZ9759473.1 hypothetical protein [Mesorhizobium sp. CA8]